MMLERGVFYLRDRSPSRLALAFFFVVQSKNTVFTGTDIDIDSNKKVLGTIRIDSSVPSLSIWSRAATAHDHIKLYFCCQYLLPT
jgi:hypothetical protein